LLAVAIGSVGLAIFTATPAAAQLSREKGAIYFEDFLDEKIELLAVAQVPIYSTAQKRSAVGHLKKGRKVEVLAKTDTLYMIRGMALHGQVKGWVPPAALTDLGKDFVKNLDALYERQKIVNEMIAEKQIALGMKIKEVVASMGKPARKSTKLTKEGRTDSYEYITYERVPQYQTGRNIYGNLVRQKVYVKVETGKLTVNFKDEIVESIEETEGEPLAGADVKIVPYPIELY
jgi:hypothetical protein